MKIMLDPGHDRARYNQSPVVPEYWEGERMWKLSQLLATALRKHGISVGCTKEQCDQTVEVTARGRMAKGYTALISLHTNACADPNVDRPIGIYLVDDDCGSIDEASRDLAKVLSETAEDIMGTSPAEQYSRTSTRDRDGDGKINDDYYGVLYGAHQVGVPAVILEISFHTNATAAAWLMEDANLEKLAEGLTQAVMAWAGEKEGTAVNMKTLKKRSTGPQVKALQALLIGLGFNCGRCGADGDFGGATDSALRKYQSRHGLEPDGIAGAKTWGSLLGQ